MNFLIAYFKGIWQVIRSVKIIAIHYLLLLILALLSTLPFLNLMEAKVGRSRAIEKLLPDFDYTVYQDFKNMPGVKDTLGAIIDLNFYLAILFVVLTVFLTGGVLKLYKANTEKYTLQSFFAGCTYYFWRLLRLTAYFLIVHAAIAGIFVLIYQQMTKGGFADLGSEVGYIEVLKMIVPAYIVVASWFFMVQDYAKIHLVHQDNNWLYRPFWQSFSLVFRNFFSTFLLYLLNAATFLGIVILFYYLNQMILTDALPGIALAFLLGQAFVIARIAVRLLNLASATLLYQKFMEKRNKRISTAKEAEDLRLAAIVEAEAEADRAKAQAEEAERRANIATQKANLAEQAAAAIVVNTPVPGVPIPPTEPDALRVVPPPPISRQMMDEEE